jgi:hypothetical protein
MIANGMARQPNSLQHIRVFLGIVPYAEKGGLRVGLLQLLQHPGGYLGVGPIIKSEVQLLPLCRAFPYQPPWKKCP